MSDFNPFLIKGAAFGDGFFNRSQEIQTLISRVQSGQHTLLLAPRRIGKTSLLRKVADHIRKEQGVRIINIDLFRCSNLNEFCAILIRETLRSESSSLAQSIEKILKVIQNKLPRLAPKISFNALGDPEIGIELSDRRFTLEDVEETLIWMDRSSKKVLLILDEIQEIVSFDPDHRIEKSLRAIIQKLDRTVVLYSGSAPTILSEMFSKRNRAFFQSALTMPLGFCSEEDVRKFLKTSFQRAKLPVADVVIEAILSLTRGHPYYVQLAGHLSWEHLRLKQAKIDHTYAQTLKDAIFQHEQTQFETSISLLTPQQRQVYRAIAADPFQKINSSEFLQKHRLPAQSSVRKALQKLEALGFVLKDERGYFPSDPLLGLWWGRG